mmetsp:Transcript_29128/g.71961  ORF Transcript_29128/g.71961 Transcript_29128/m.71961 type:complete len:208 (-) Transcript_29128:33-656(-)
MSAMLKFFPHSLQMRRAQHFSTKMSSRSVRLSTDCTSANVLSASAWGTVRGNPSSRNPRSPLLLPLSTRPFRMSRIMASGSSCPLLVISSIWAPRAVPRLISSRTRSPAEMCGIFMSLEIRVAYVPLPTPGAPRNTQLMRWPAASALSHAATNSSASASVLPADACRRCCCCPPARRAARGAYTEEGAAAAAAARAMDRQRDCIVRE